VKGQENVRAEPARGSFLQRPRIKKRKPKKKAAHGGHIENAPHQAVHKRLVGVLTQGAVVIRGGVSKNWETDANTE